MSDPLALREVNDLEIPAQIALTYINIDNDYQSDTQYSDRLISATSTTIDSIQLAIGMTPSEAKMVADAMLADQVASRLSGKFSILGDYTWLEPTDVITVTGADASTFRMRIVNKLDAYPLLEVDLVLDDATVIEQLGITSADYTSSTTVTGAVATTLRLLDIPILQDADDSAGFYAAAKGAETPWPGAALLDSPDNVTYTRRATIAESAVIGTTTTALNNWHGARVVDAVSRVNVNVGEGTISSTTRALALNSQTVNAFLIGNEIVQAITATLLSSSPNIYTLSDFLRGARGTEWAMTGHATGERVVQLREAGLRRIALTNSQLGVARYYKGVTLGREESSATGSATTIDGIALKPFAPFDLRASRDGSNNITGTFQRRSRLSVRMIGALGISVPLSESPEAYEIDVMSEASPQTVLRTISVGTTTFSYSAADQTTDTLTPGNPVTFMVYQISPIVGRGYALEGTV